jgi:hypothetical protein
MMVAMRPEVGGRARDNLTMMARASAVFATSILEAHRDEHHTFCSGACILARQLPINPSSSLTL